MLTFKTSTSSGKDFSLDKATVPLLLSFILTVMTIHCGFLAVEFGFNANDAKPIPFNSKAWKENRDPLDRYLMTKNCNFGERFNGLTRSQAIDLLGLPDGESSEKSTLCYKVKYGFRCDEDSTFELGTEKGIITGILIQPLICDPPCALDYLLPFRYGADGNFYWQQWHDIEVLKRFLHI